MLNDIKLKNFGPLVDVQWSNLDKINLVIGGNGSGKTFLLKALYSAVRTLEEYRRGNEPRADSDILIDKLYWTFQPDKIGDLVSKGTEEHLHFSSMIEKKDFEYEFGKDTSKHLQRIRNNVDCPLTSNSIFLPAKEILSLHHIILKSREQDKAFGFDDTYYDLAKALRNPPQRGRNYDEFAKARHALNGILNGRVEYDETSKQWYFKRGNQKFPIGVTAEGIKKISILDTLLSNRYLDTNSIIFIDEPESALHPSAIAQFMDIISLLADSGIQFFLATHSYFVIKKLLLIALEKKRRIPVLAAEDEGWTSHDLQDGMPDNKIINESIKLYKEEVELGLK